MRPSVRVDTASLGPGRFPGMENTHALVRRPSPRLADGLLTHRDREAIDIDRAQRQWEDYVAALHAHGWRTTEVEPVDDCPDSVFVEDSVVVYGDLAVITRPGADERKPETAGTERAVRALGYRVARIEAPGTLDGGDVLKSHGRVWVGNGGRTNAEGIRQLSAVLRDVGAETIPVPIRKVLHLKSAVTALPDGTVLGYPPLVDDPGVYGDAFLAVPEETGAIVVCLGGNRLLMQASAPESIELIRGKGYEVTVVDVSEFEKLEGCITCLSVRLRGVDTSQR